MGVAEIEKNDYFAGRGTCCILIGILRGDRGPSRCSTWRSVAMRGLSDELLG